MADFVIAFCTVGQFRRRVTTEESKAYVTLHKIPTDFFLKPRRKPSLQPPLAAMSGALGRGGGGGSIRSKPRRKVSGKLERASPCSGWHNYQGTGEADISYARDFLF
jgi:hypothetical protein